MPCSTCGHLLLVDHERSCLVCPECLNLDLEDPNVVQKKVDRDRELLRDENLITLMEEFDKGNLLLSLIERLNIISQHFFENRRINLKSFSYLNYLIKIIYPEDADNFGDEYMDRESGFDERLEMLLDSQALLVKNLNHVEDKFTFCVKYGVPMPDGKFLFGDYNLYDSEYHYCFIRCLKSLIGGREEDVDLFDETHQKIRRFELTPLKDVETLEEFTYTSFEFIASMLFVASADDIVGDIYSTRLPDHVSVFDLTEFLDKLDEQFVDDEGQFTLQTEILGWTNLEGLNEAGEQVFGDNWPDVREDIVISESNLDAHPFLFQIEVELPIYQQQGRPPVTREYTRIVYPHLYAKILRFQIFPLLKNGDQVSGHELLTSAATERGQEFERYVFDYLCDEGFNCYYSAEIPGVDSSEIDVLAIDDKDREMWFIECKYLLPELSMNTAEGIESLNSKFDHKVFNEPSSHYESSPTGQPFPEKVEEWLELENAKFNFEKTSEASDNTAQFHADWLDLTTRMLVVSNLTPSYVEKQGVEFRTDLEFVELVNGKEQVYEIKH